MSKLSDSGLVLLISGTLIIIISLYLGFAFKFVSFFTFLIFQIIGWVIFGLSFIPIILTKDEYHVVMLKNGFPLKVDQFIIAISTLSILTSFIVIIGINSLIFGMGGIGNSSALFLTILASSIMTLLYLRSQIKKNEQVKS